MITQLKKVINYLGMLSSVSLFFLISSCKVSKDYTIKAPVLCDSLLVHVPKDYYNPFMAFPLPKLDLETQSFYFMAGGNKNIIHFDLKKDEIHRVVNCERIPDLQYVFNLIPLEDSSFMVFFGPDQGAFHDNFVGFVSDSSIYFPDYNYDGTNILTLAYDDSIDYYTATFPNPFFIDPILGEDSSLILPCHFGTRIPGTEAYNRLDQGKFVEVYPKSVKKAAHFLPPRFSDVIPKGKIFGRGYDGVHGWMEDNKLVWGYDINNDIHIYDLSNNKLTTVSQNNPFFSEIQTTDTLEDKEHDYSQVEFIYLIRNPYRKEVYRVIEKPRRTGFYVIVMDDEFNEKALYELPKNITYPILCSKRGIYGYVEDSYAHNNYYQFNEFVFE